MNVKVGNVTVKVYPTPVGKYPAWTVTWKESDGRKRKVFSGETGEADAVKFANAKAEALDCGLGRAVSAETLAAYARAEALLLPTGKPIELVAAEVAACHKMTGGVSLEQLGECWIKHHLTVSDASIETLKEEFIKAKRQDGMSDDYLRDLTQRLTKFANSFQMPIASVTAPMLEDWLRNMKVGRRSRDNYLGAIRTLVGYAKARRYLPRDWDELPVMGATMASDHPIEIYTPDELRKLLAAARQSERFDFPILPFIVFGAFAGIRTKEIQRLTWDKVGEHYIRVQSKRTRSASKRLVPMLPNLAKWLETIPNREGQGRVCLYNNISTPTARLGEVAKMSWKHNALRHSFISYRVADIENVEKVSIECGNSPAIIFAHYRELVTKEQAKEWFSILP